MIPPARIHVSVIYNLNRTENEVAKDFFTKWNMPLDDASSSDIILQKCARCKRGSRNIGYDSEGIKSYCKECYESRSMTSAIPWTKDEHHFRILAFKITIDKNTLINFDNICLTRKETEERLARYCASMNPGSENYEGYERIAQYMVGTYWERLKPILIQYPNLSMESALNRAIGLHGEESVQVDEDELLHVVDELEEETEVETQEEEEAETETNETETYVFNIPRQFIPLHI